MNPCEEIALKGKYKPIKDLIDKQDKQKNSWIADKLYTGYINNLLGSPFTLVKNFASTGAQAMIRIPEAAVSAAFRAKMNNQAIGPHFRVAQAELYGMGAGAIDALRFIGKRASAVRDVVGDAAEGGVFRHTREMRYPDRMVINAKHDLNEALVASKGQSTEAVGGALGIMARDIVKAPGNALSNTDIAFKMIHYRAELHKQAALRFGEQIDYAGEGLYAGAKARARDTMSASPMVDVKDRDLVKRINKAWGDGDPYTAEILEDARRAINSSEVNTFTNVPEGPFSNWFARDGHKLGGMRWVAPFRRATINVFNAGVERTPLAFAYKLMPNSRIGKGLSSKDPNVRADAYTKIVTGSAVLTGLFTAVDFDGKSPSTTYERQIWEENGHRENSIWVGNTPIKFEYLGGIGEAMKMMANYRDTLMNMDLENDDNAMEQMAAMGGAVLLPFAESLMDVHWASGVGDALNALDKSMKYPDDTSLQKEFTAIAANITAPRYIIDTPRFIDNVMQANLPPGALAEWDRVMTKYIPEHAWVREAKGMEQTFAKKWPLLARGVPPKISMWGDPITYSKWAGPEVANPFRDSGGAGDMVTRELEFLDVDVPRMTRSITLKGMTVPLTQAEFMVMSIYAGKGPKMNMPLKDSMAQLMMKPYYQRAPSDAHRKDMMKEVILKYRSAAREAILTNSDFNLQDRFKAEMMRKKTEYNVR